MAASARLTQLSQRLEALSLRERVLLLAGLPLALVLVAEALVFDPARKKTVQTEKLITTQQAELKSLASLLAQTPTTAALPAADQLERQRDDLRAQIEGSQALVAGLRETVDWGTVVRGAVAGTPGLTLTSLRALPPELVFSPTKAAATAQPPGRPAAAAASAAAPAAAAASGPAPAWAQLSVYRHRAELTVQGDFAAVQGYLQTLQRVPGALHWEKLDLNVAQYPQAQVRLSLYTLSDRAQTPFN